MTAQDQTTNPQFLGNYLRRIYQPRYLWLHVLLAGIILSLGIYSAGTWWGGIASALATYVFVIAFGLYCCLGWVTLRVASPTPVLPSVTFITACMAFALTLGMLATPNPMRPYWWLGPLWPIVGFPGFFVFFKFLRGTAYALTGLRNGE